MSSESYQRTLLNTLSLDWDAEHSAPPAPEPDQKMNRTPIFIAAATLAVVLAALFFEYGITPDDDHTLSSDKPYLLTLPLDVSSSDQETWRPFGDQATREIIRNLRKVSGLRVVPAPTALTFAGDKTRKNIRSHLPDVQYVLDGLISVQPQGNVRITVSLEDLSQDGQIIWDDTYFFSPNDTDVFEVQSQIAAAVSDSLRVFVNDNERAALRTAPTSNINAYNEYAAGVESAKQGTKESFYNSIEHFDAAISIDPRFVLAHIAKAKSYRQLMSFFEPPVEILPHVQAAATEALALDPGSAEARTALGLAYLHSWRFNDAWRYLNDAKGRDPTLSDTHIGLALYYASLGEKDLAFQSLAQANDLNPLDLEVAIWGSFIHMLFQNYSEGVAFSDEKLSVLPNIPVLNSNSSWLYALAGLHDRAIEVGNQALDLGHRAPFFLVSLGYTYAAAGEHEKALELVMEAEAQEDVYTCPYESAVVYAELGEKDHAFDLLDEAITYRSNCLMFTRQDPRLEPLRSDLRYGTLLENVGLDNQTIKTYRLTN
jgi:TolB-like protein/Tfp pilus assembly protein PilF